MEEQAEQELDSIGFFDPAHPLAHIGRKIPLGVSILAGVVIYYIARYSKASDILHTLRSIALPLIIGMLTLEVLYFFIQGGFFQRVYRMLGYSRGIKYLTILYLGMNLVNTVAP